MSEQISEYRYLWDGSEEGWVLLSAPKLCGGFCIFNENSRFLMHIDDEELNAALCDRMKNSGAKMMSDEEFVRTSREVIVRALED